MNSAAPTMQKEKELYEKGYRHIVGIDEVGRGAWAGPLVACAIILPFHPRVYRVRDSKLLSSTERVELAKRLQEIAQSIGVGIAQQSEIDAQGIQQANKLAMQRAVQQLSVQPDYLLIDGRMTLDGPHRQISIIRGDQLVYSIAAASIIAKVRRDHLMEEYHDQFPVYGFAEHKGYGTALHRRELQRNGVSAIHRRSFQPMKSMID